MARKAQRVFSTPSIPPPQGFGPAHEVTAAGGGRTVVGGQVAKGERKALWRDNETGAWCEFPPNDLSYFRTPGADSIFATGFQSRMRPRGGTYMKPIWPSPQFEDVSVVISILPTDVLTNPAPSPPASPQPAPTKKRKQAAPPRGRPADYEVDAIREATKTYIAEIGLPNTCSMLMEKVKDVLDVKSIRVPGLTRFRKLVGPIYKRAKKKRRPAKKH